MIWHSWDAPQLLSLRSSDLMLESTLSSVTTFYQVSCGCQDYGFQLPLHASIPGRQDPVPAGGLHVPGGRQSFCMYWELNEFAFSSHLLWFCDLLPVVSLADLHDVYSEGHSCFCTQWRSPQILFLCQWVCSYRLRTRWRCSIYFIFLNAFRWFAADGNHQACGCCDSTCGPDGGIVASFRGK